jgi:hypothetical protein
MLAARHTWHLHEVMAARAAARRIRRITSVRAPLLHMLRRHAYDAPVPAGAGGRP